MPGARCDGVVVLDVREAVVRTRRRSSLSRRSTDLEMIKKVRVVTGLVCE